MIKISAGPRFTHLATGNPGNIHTGAVPLVNTNFLRLVTMFSALLVMRNEMFLLWNGSPGRLAAKGLAYSFSGPGFKPCSRRNLLNHK